MIYTKTDFVTTIDILTSTTKGLLWNPIMVKKNDVNQILSQQLINTNHQRIYYDLQNGPNRVLSQQLNSTHQPQKDYSQKFKCENYSLRKKTANRR